jgi:hypothetical protein
MDAFISRFPGAYLRRIPKFLLRPFLSVYPSFSDQFVCFLHLFSFPPFFQCLKFGAHTGGKLMSISFFHVKVTLTLHCICPPPHPIPSHPVHFAFRYQLLLVLPTGFLYSTLPKERGSLTSLLIPSTSTSRFVPSFLPFLSFSLIIPTIFFSLFSLYFSVINTYMLDSDPDPSSISIPSPSQPLFLFYYLHRRARSYYFPLSLSIFLSMYAIVLLFCVV